MYSRCLQRPLASHARFSIARYAQGAATASIRSLSVPSQPTSSTQTESMNSAASPLKPQWGEEKPTVWTSLLGGIHEQSQKVSSPTHPESLWQRRERSLVANLPKPDTPFSGVHLVFLLLKLRLISWFLSQVAVCMCHEVVLLRP